MQKLVLSIIEDEGERRVFLLGRNFGDYTQVNVDTLPLSVQEKVAFLRLTGVNKFQATQFGRKISDWHLSVYLTSEEYKQIDNTRKESEGQGSKATEKV
jgi:hypothetical protein